MQLFVTAEGVETVEPLQSLRNAHCDEAQGIDIGRSMPATEARVFPRARSAPKRPAA